MSNLTEITIVVNDTKATKTIVNQKIDRILKPLEEKLEAILNKTDVLGKIAKEKLAKYEDTSVTSTESRKSEQILSDLFAKSKLLIFYSIDINLSLLVLRRINYLFFIFIFIIKMNIFIFLFTIQMFAFQCQKLDKTEWSQRGY